MVDGTRVVLVGDGNVRTFFLTTEADGILELDAVERIAIFKVKDAEIKLADSFLRGEFDLLFS